MHTIKYCLVVLLITGVTSFGTLKFFAFKGPYHGFVGFKVHKAPKFYGLKHDFGHGGGFGGFGGFGGGGYEHHEYHHESHSIGYDGDKFGWLGK